MKKNTLLITSACALFALAGCKTNSTNTIDNSSLTTNIAKTWFSLGQYTDDYKFSDNYKINLYDPASVYGFKGTNYMRVHAHNDYISSLRMTKTEISADMFSDNKVNRINYLQTSNLSSSTQDTILSNISAKISGFNSTFTDYDGHIQTTWQKDISEYNISSESLSSTETNYLYVIYLPMFVRIYQNSTLTVSTFVCAPIYAAVSCEENSTTNSIVSSMKDKIVTLEYSNNVIR